MFCRKKCKYLSKKSFTKHLAQNWFVTKRSLKFGLNNFYDVRFAEKNESTSQRNLLPSTLQRTCSFGKGI
jgi:hypothetical protein